MKLPDRFMVIDDDQITTIICEQALAKFSPVTPTKIFNDPEVALETIKEEYGVSNDNIPTVMFLDINMPAMTGWEFLDEFKNFSAELRKQFTIFILSSSINEQDKEKADANPFVSGFISKPLRLQTLIQILA
jgi:CheY-like chemotaxis protein